MLLFVSDNSEFIAEYAKKHNNEFQLLTEENYHSISSSGSYYTSLADLPWDKLLEVCLQSNEIVYFPPPTWQSVSLKDNTELFLKNLVLHHKISVKGYTVATDKYNVLGLKNIRNTQGKQLWIAGCSYAAGRGLVSDQDRYASHLSAMLKLPYCDLSDVATSISWSADQLLRSDLRSGDIVIWSLTSINRKVYYNQDQHFFATSRTIDNLANTDKLYFSRLLLDDNAAFEAVQSVKQVINICNKLNCNLVIFTQNGLSLSGHQHILKEYLESELCYLNISDVCDFAPMSSKHPGPKTNANWAQEIFDFITSRYCNT